MGVVDELPFIDEHSVRVAAEPEAVWTALGEALARHQGGATAVVARALGCEPDRGSGDPSQAGATVPGFDVVRAERPRILALCGRHRFSRYALTFTIDPAASGALLRAESRAEFPGPAGRVYRTLVIGSRGHVLAVNSLLSGIARRAVALELRRARPAR